MRHTILICNILPWCVPSDTPLLQLLSVLELLLALTFYGLVTAKPQLIVGYLDDILHVLEKTKFTGSEGWLVRRMLKYCDLLLGQELLQAEGSMRWRVSRDPALSSWSLNDPV